MAQLFKSVPRLEFASVYGLLGLVAERTANTREEVAFLIPELKWNDITFKIVSDLIADIVARPRTHE